MKAIGFKKSCPITAAESLMEFEKEIPSPGSHDLLVEVKAVSVNPVDAKVRMAAAQEYDPPRILGYDAVGIVKKLGAAASGFAENERIYYSGVLNRDGSNAEYQLVDSRIAARAPQSLDNAQAAALPLTALTAWEAFFDRLLIDEEKQGTLLIIGAGGGAGSIAIQIAKAVTKLTVIATASRPETETWVKEMGADYVANHRDLVNSVRQSGLQTVDYIFNAADTLGHWDAMVELIAPQGKICSIVETKENLNLSKLQGKAVTFVWEFMFVRPLFQTDDIAEQGRILAEIAALVDAGKIKTTLTKTIPGGLSVDSLKEAHRDIESGKTIGKIAIPY